jgi:ATP adenylyltransferase
VDRLWSPWRYDYIKANGGGTDESSGCVFCSIQREDCDDESKFILYRGEHNYVVLNIFPYISGHLLIVPFSHIPDLDATPKEITDEMMDLAKRCQTALRQAYNPQGFNIGMNLGRSAGAGVAGHIHLHMMPRWTGDVNFMSTVAETRVIPEDLKTTFEKLSGNI